MPAIRKRIPQYCRVRRPDRSYDLGYVRIGGKVRYLGEYNSEKSLEAYQRLLAELQAAPTGDTPPPSRDSAPQRDLTIVEICAAYLDFAQAYYVKNGRQTSELANVRRALRVLKTLYGSTRAADFGPLALHAIQQHLVTTPIVDRRNGKPFHYTRTTVNETVNSIRRVFRWAAAKELVPGSVHTDLTKVDGLKQGRTVAKDRPPVLPAADPTVDATLPHLPPVIADMVRFQRLTGCRPGEVCTLRPADLDRSRDVWEYRPESHKTEHHGRQRVIFIGPKAKALLIKYLLRGGDSYCFSPAASEAERHTAMRVRRKTRVQPSQRNRKKARPARAPRTHYSKDSYNRAIRRACEIAFNMPEELRKAGCRVTAAERKRLAALPAADGERERKAAQEARQKLLERAAQWRAEHCWRPNQLRHARATEIRRRFGLEATQVVLGHAKADVTQVYAERDFALAAEIMGKIG